VVVDVVYKADEARLGRHVVMKFSTDEYSGDRRAPDRFQHGAHGFAAESPEDLYHPRCRGVRAATGCRSSKRVAMNR